MEIKPQLDQMGVRLIGIGTGSKIFGKKFRDLLPFTGEIFIDPEFAAFKAKGLPRLSAWEVTKRFIISWTAVSHYKSLSSKYRSSDTDGDGQQTGGVFVIGPDPSHPEKKRILYSFHEIENDVSTFADIEAILAECKKNTQT